MYLIIYEVSDYTKHCCLLLSLLFIIVRTHFWTVYIKGGKDSGKMRAKGSFLFTG